MGRKFPTCICDPVTAKKISTKEWFVPMSLGVRLETLDMMKNDYENLHGDSEIMRGREEI